MKYSDLVKKVAKLTRVSQSTAKDVLDEMCNVIRETIEGGDEVVLNKVGKLSKKTRAARTVLNPVTKEKIEIPTTETVAFKVAKEFKDYINQK